MKGLAIAALLIVATVFQSTVAHLFPVRGAVFDFGLAALVVTYVWAGPRHAMVALPVAALLISFATDRAPGLLLLAYVPLLPIAYALEERNAPLTRYAHTLAAGVATGAWARTVLATGPMLEGAGFAGTDLLFVVLVPGLFLDILLVTLAYLPFRLLGWSARPMTLHRSGFGA